MPRLRRLREGVEHAAVDAARHEVVARALGRRGREDGRLVLVEALGPHLLAQEADHLGAQDDVVVQLFAAEVEEPVLEAHLLALLGLVVRDVERRDAGGALHDELVRLNLDLAGGEVGVDRLGVAELHLARHGDDAFEVRLLDEAKEAAARVHDDLGDAVVVAQVYEQDAAVVAEAEHPAGEPDRLAGVLLAELVAGMRSVGMHVHFDSLLLLRFRLWRRCGGGRLPRRGGHAPAEQGHEHTSKQKVHQDGADGARRRIAQLAFLFVHGRVLYHSRARAARTNRNNGAAAGTRRASQPADPDQSRQKNDAECGIRRLGSRENGRGGRVTRPPRPPQRTSPRGNKAPE